MAIAGEKTPNSFPITVQLQWKHQFKFAGFYAALEKGFYEQRGLNVELKEYQTGMDVVEEVLSGQAQYGVFHSGIMKARLEKKPVVLLANYFKRSPLAIITRPDIISLAYLRAKRLMLTEQELNSPLFQFVFTVEGLELAQDINIVPHTFDVQAFIQGDVDAMSVDLTYEPFELAQKNIPFKLTQLSKYILSLGDAYLFSSEAYVTQYPQQSQAFIEATNAGWEYALQHPDEIIDVILTQYSQQKSRAALAYEASKTAALIEADKLPIGSVFDTQIEANSLLIANHLGIQNLDSLDGFIWKPNPSSYVIPQLNALLTTEEQIWLQQHKGFKVGAFSLEPYIIQKKGQITGYMVELLRLTARQAGLTPQFQFMPFEQVLNQLEQGQLDAGISMLHSPKRAEYLNFSDEIYPVRLYSFAHLNRTDISDLASLSDKKIATFKGYALNALFKQNLPSATLIYADTHEDMLRLVSNGEADVAIQEINSGEYDLRRYLIANVERKSEVTFNEKRYLNAHYYTVHKQLPLLLSILNKSWQVLPEVDKQNLWQQWFFNVETVTTTLNFTLKEQAWLAQNREILLGIDKGWVPYIVQMDNGETRGVEGDLINKINELTGTRLRLVSGQWSELVKQAEQGLIDGLAASMAHPEREKDFFFTDSLYSAYKYIYIKDVNSAYIRNMDDLSGKKVGFLRGNIAEQKLLKKWDNIELVALEDNVKLLTYLLNGEIDAAISGVTLLLDTRKELIASINIAFPVPGSEVKLRYSIRKEYPELNSIINKAQAEIGAVEMQKILERWRIVISNDTTQKLNLTLQETEWLKQHEQLKYCFSPSWSPYDVWEAGAHQGIFADYLALIKKKLNIELTPVKTKSWVQALEFARERKCDLLSGAVPTADRRQYLNFTSPYFEIVQVLLAKPDKPFIKGLEVLSNKKIGVLRGSAIEQILKIDYPQLILVPLETNEVLSSLEKGKIYTVIVSLEHAASYIGEQIFNYKIIGKLDYPYLISIATRNDMPELSAVMEKAVLSISQAEHAEIQGKWIKYKLTEDIDYTLLWKTITATLCVILILWFWNRKLKQVNEQLQKAKLAADLANHAKSSFLANMSHELRTPLNGILGYTQILQQQTQLTSMQKHGIAVIENSGQHLLNLINEILDIAKIEAGKFDLVPSPVNLKELLNNVVSMVQVKAELSNLGLKLECDPLPDLIEADEKRLQQVLLNLLGNAIKFTEQGHIYLRVKNIAETAQQLSLHFEVADTGLGIPASDMHTVFQPFEQVKQHSAHIEGTGLGLSICYNFISLMNGKIGLLSRQADKAWASTQPYPFELPAYAHGTIIWFDLVLPILREQIEHSRFSQVIGISGKAPHLLVVDDNTSNRELIVQLLMPLGIKVYEASHVQEALQILHTYTLDIIITDLLMPDIDGFEFIRQIRYNPKWQHLAIIVSSATVDKSQRTYSLELGANAFLAKPVQIEHLYQLLSQLAGVEWIYVALEAPVEANITEHEVPALSLLTDLQQAAEAGDIDTLLSMSHYLQSDYPLFAEQVENLASNLRLEELIEFLQSAQEMA